MVRSGLEIALGGGPGGRTLSYDDVGDPEGRVVVYLHGTPDSRLARHPDDGLVARAGIRLLAVDRPGYGGTSPPASGSGFADDLAQLLDTLEIERTAALAWSGGALDALRVAGADAGAGADGLGDRLEALTVVAGLVPADAYTDPDVRAATPERLALLDLAEAFPPRQAAEAVAPLLAPYPCDLPTALDHQREQRRPEDRAVLAAVPGAVERMAEALVEAVRHGLAGVETDLQAQIQPWGELALRRVAGPVRLVYGSADTTTPPVLGLWYARHLPQAELEIVEGAGHYLPFTHWPRILDGLGPLSGDGGRGTGPPG